MPICSADAGNVQPARMPCLNVVLLRVIETKAGCGGGMTRDEDGWELFLSTRETEHSLSRPGRRGTYRVVDYFQLRQSIIVQSSRLSFAYRFLNTQVHPGQSGKYLSQSPFNIRTSNPGSTACILYTLPHRSPHHSPFLSPIWYHGV